MNVMMYAYQSEEAAQQLFSNSNPTNRTTQIFQKLVQSVAGGSSYKVRTADKICTLTDPVYVLIVSPSTVSFGYSDCDRN